MRDPLAGMLSGAVGIAAMNRDADVRTVQHLLNIVAPAAARPLPEDGVCSAELIRSINGFQLRVLRFTHPDGRVDPIGRTLRGLVEHAHRVRRFRPTPGPVPSAPTAGARNAGRDLRAHVWSYLDRMAAALQDLVKRQAAVTSKPAGSATGARTPLTSQDFVEAAAALGPGISAALVQAFAEVESGGRSGFGPSGLPVIAYEGHIFRRLTKSQYDKTHPLLSYKYVKKAGPEWKKNNKDQASAWKTLEDALALDHDAALQSCSWGMFQVMGFNYRDCGYRSVDDFVAAMKTSARGQLDAFIGYCRKKSGMTDAMTRKNFARMATLYNGEDYGDYDQRIARACKKHGGT